MLIASTTKIASFAALLFSSLLAGPAAFASETEWVDEVHSKVRLVSGTVSDAGAPRPMAGIQIRLDPGWKTYWRMPGDSGVPPSFDWSGSKNLRQAEVLYPAPKRFADAGGTAVGYEKEVVFPVKITPERPGEPVELKLRLDYGLCKTLCIPSEASLSLELSPGARGSGEDLLLQRFVDLVPKPAEPGKLPALEQVETKFEGAKPELILAAQFPADASETDLFVEAGDRFVPVPMPLGPPQDGKQRFLLRFASPKESESFRGKPLTLTLVSDKGARETSLTLD